MSKFDIQSFYCSESTKLQCQKFPPHFCPLNKESKEITLQRFETWKKENHIETESFVHKWLDFDDALIHIGCDVCFESPIIGIRFIAFILNKQGKVTHTFDVCQECWKHKKVEFQGKYDVFFSVRHKFEEILYSSVIKGNLGRLRDPDQNKIIWSIDRPDMKSPPLQCVDCSQHIISKFHHCYVCENSYYCDDCYLKHINFPEHDHQHLFISVPLLTEKIADNPQTFIDSIIDGSYFKKSD